MLLDISKFEQFVDDYIAFRGGATVYGYKCNPWNEAYKWSILPRVHTEVFKDKITKDNVINKINKLWERLPKGKDSGPFCHWTYLDNLRECARKKPSEIAKLLSDLTYGQRRLSEKIDIFNDEIGKFKNAKSNKKIKLGPAFFGYYFASFDPNKYPLYINTVFLYIRRELGANKEWQSFTTGQKYEKFTDVCIDMGNRLIPFLRDRHVIDEKYGDVNITADYTALNGQDFFFSLVMYWNRPTIPHTVRKGQFDREFEKRVEQSKKDDSEVRKKRLLATNGIPQRGTSISTVYRRNPDVVAEVEYRANGKCEECGADAPFIKASDKSPYLEIHHLIWLSKGGEDTVENAIAVCPNCHRKLHFGINETT